MTISYDTFTEAFLSKISEYEFIRMTDVDRERIVDGFLKRAMSQFRPHLSFEITPNQAAREFTIDADVTIGDADIDKITDIVSEGMVAQWLKTYLNKQEQLQNVLTTRDYSAYSPANLLDSIGEAYDRANNGFIQAMREYSFQTGDLTRLHI